MLPRKGRSSGIKVLHNPHCNCEGSLFLHIFIRNHFGFRRIGEKADLGYDCRDCVVPEKIVIRVGFDFSLIFLTGQVHGLRLNEGGQSLAVLVASLIKDLCAVLCAVWKAVLVNAYRTVWSRPCNGGLPVP